MTLVRSVATIGGFTVLSRVLGLVRDIAIAAVMGAGPVADTFFIAFRLPNFFRRLFAEGALNAAFVPIFTRLYAAEGLAMARHCAEQIFAVLFIILVIFVAVIELLLPWLMYGIAPGFAAHGEQFALTIDLARITFPYILLMSLAAFYGGILNSLGKFTAASASPLLLNVTMVGALGSATTFHNDAGYALAWSVIVAGILQLWWVMASARHNGIILNFSRPTLSPIVKQLLRSMAPGALGAGLMQINLFVDTMLASLLPTGAVSYLYYADRLNQLPLSLLGIGISTALLPLLSKHFEQGNHDAAHSMQNRTLEWTLVLTLPAALAFVTLGDRIISLLFERNHFTIYDVQETAKVLVALACGLPAYILSKILSTSFFAQYNMKTPVKMAMVAMMINIILNLVLMQPFGYVGIAAATAITGWLNAAMLALRLRRSQVIVVDDRLRGRLPRIILSASLMAVIVYGLKLIMPWQGCTILTKVVTLMVMIASGTISYGVLTVITKAVDIKELLSMIRRTPSNSKSITD